MGVKISNLPAIVTPALTDVFPVVQAGVTYKETVTQLQTLLGTVGVTTITGTANQVIASAAVGPVTLSLPQSIATTNDVTFGSITFSTTTKGIVGTTTNNNASATYVGEFISSVILVGAALPMTTSTELNITSIALTAGDWDVWGTLWLAPAAGTITTSIAVGVSQTSATLPTTPAIGGSTQQIRGISTAATEVCILGAPTTRISLAAPATVYLVGFSIFTTSTMSGYGSLCARRVR